MGIDPNTVQRFAGVFLDALGLHADTALDARRQASYQLDLASELLPRTIEWAVVGRGDDAALLLLSAARDALYTLTRGTPAGQDPQIIVTSHPARVLEVTYWRDGQQTFWRFRFRHRDPLPIEGRIDYRAHPEDAETFDQSETFARALARRAEWELPNSR